MLKAVVLTLLVFAACYALGGMWYGLPMAAAVFWIATCEREVKDRGEWWP